MKLLFIILISTGILLSANSNKVFSCNKIFEQRKAELILELDKIDEQQQALEALQYATAKVLNVKEENIKKKELEVKNTLAKIEQTKDEIKKIYEKNKKTLKDINREKDDKIVETYTKMKAGAAAAVISEIKAAVAASIMFNLTPKQAAKILAKMEPIKAAKLTELLKKGPPFISAK